MNNSTAIIAVAAVAILGVGAYAIYASKAAQQASAEAAVAGYDAGYARGSKRTRAEKIGGAIGTLGEQIVPIVGAIF